MNTSTSERRAIDATPRVCQVIKKATRQESHTARLANIGMDRDIAMTTRVARSSDRVGMLHDWIRANPGAPCADDLRHLRRILAAAAVARPRALHVHQPMGSL